MLHAMHLVLHQVLRALDSLYICWSSFFPLRFSSFLIEKSSLLLFFVLLNLCVLCFIFLSFFLPSLLWLYELLFFFVVAMLFGMRCTHAKLHVDRAIFRNKFHTDKHTVTLPSKNHPTKTTRNILSRQCERIYKMPKWKLNRITSNKNMCAPQQQKKREKRNHR